MNTDQRRPMVHNGLWSGDDYTIGTGSVLKVNGVAITGAAPLPAPRAKVVALPVPFGPEDEDLAEERALIGAVLTGIITAETALDLTRSPFHRELLEVLVRFDLGDADRLSVAISVCRMSGLPPEIVGTVIEGKPVGYLASCRAKAPSEEGAVDLMGRVRRRKAKKK